MIKILQLRSFCQPFTPEASAQSAYCKFTIRTIAPPVTWMLSAPLLYPFDISWVTEVILVLRFLQPSSLTIRLVGSAAFGLETEFLPFDVSRVRVE